MNEILEFIQSPNFIILATQVITVLAVVFKLASNVKTLTKQKNLTTKNVLDALMLEIPQEVAKGIEKVVAEIVLPLREDLNAIQPVLKDFGKILALSQENTPESRVAILNVISDMGKVVDKEQLDKARAVIELQVEQAKQKAEDVKAVIKEIETKNKPVE